MQPRTTRHEAWDFNSPEICYILSPPFCFLVWWSGDTIIAYCIDYQPLRICFCFDVAQARTAYLFKIGSSTSSRWLIRTKRHYQNKMHFYVFVAGDLRKEIYWCIHSIWNSAAIVAVTVSFHPLSPFHSPIYCERLPIVFFSSHKRKPRFFVHCRMLFWLLFA